MAMNRPSGGREQALIELIDRSPELIPCVHAIGEAVRLLVEAFAAGGKLWSAATGAARPMPSILWANS